MKICSLYGVGFYYIPGTDMCLKVGGWVRLQYQYNANGSTTVGYFANANINNRTTNDSVWRARGYVTLDARNQTPYGTVRAYMDVGFISDTIGGGGGIAAHTNRGFIQWAGFTFGQATSFYDFYSFPAVEYLAAHAGSEVGGGGWFVAGYTAQFGNGFSGTIAAEMRRQTQIVGHTGGTPGRVSTAARSPLYLVRLLAPADWLFRLPGAGHRRQPARRSGLGLRPDHGRPAPGQYAVLCRNGRRMQRAGGGPPGR